MLRSKIAKEYSNLSAYHRNSIISAIGSLYLHGIHLVVSRKAKGVHKKILRSQYSPGLPSKVIRILDRQKREGLTPLDYDLPVGICVDNAPTILKVAKQVACARIWNRSQKGAQIMSAYLHAKFFSERDLRVGNFPYL